MASSTTLHMDVTAALLLAALTWYPADGWKPAPDPDASPRARRGGTVRFNGGQGRYKTRHSHDGSHNGICLRQIRSLLQPLRPGKDPHRCIRQA